MQTYGISIARVGHTHAGIPLIEGSNLILKGKNANIGNQDQAFKIKDTILSSKVPSSLELTVCPRRTDFINLSLNLSKTRFFRYGEN